MQLVQGLLVLQDHQGRLDQVDLLVLLVQALLEQLARQVRQDQVGHQDQAVLLVQELLGQQDLQVRVVLRGQVVQLDLVPTLGDGVVANLSRIEDMVFALVFHGHSGFYRNGRSLANKPPERRPWDWGLLLVAIGCCAAGCAWGRPGRVAGRI